MTKKLFSKLLILSLIVQISIGLFTFLNQAKAAGNTYYVDNTCSNNGDGISQTCAASSGAAGPFNSIVNMQAKAEGYSSDDQILLKRGDTFRETLTPPSSGTSGHPIVFGAYPASGALPIITGADLVTEWTAQAGNTPDSSDGFEAGAADLTLGDGAYWVAGVQAGTGALAGNATSVIYGGTYSAMANWTANSATAIASHSIIGSNTMYAQFHMYVASMTGIAGAEAQFRMITKSNTPLSYISVVYKTASTFTINYVIKTSSSNITLTGSTVFNTGQWYTVEGHYKTDASVGGGTLWVNGTQEVSSLTNDTSADQANFVQVGLNYSGSTFTDGTVYFDNFEEKTSYIGSTFTNVYQSNVAYTPSQIFVGGIKGTNKVSIGALATNGDWYYSSGTLYLYETSDPPILTIEADNRVSPVVINIKNYITLQNLDIRHGNTNSNGAVAANATVGVVLSGLSIHDNSGIAGIRFRNGGSSNTITGNMVYNNWSSISDRGDGIEADDNGSDSITNNTVHDNTGQAIRLGLVQESDSNYVAYNTIYNNGSVGIGTFPADTGTTIEYNLVYANGQVVADTFGIDMFKAGNNTIVRYNIMHDHHYISVDAGGLRFDGDTGYSSTGSVAYGNIIYNEYWGIHNLNFSGVSYYNNTIYNSGVYGIIIHGTSGGTVTFKNNIVHTAGTNLVFFNGVGTLVMDYNNYYPDGASAFNWNEGTLSAFAAWKTNSSQDAHSINTDPKLNSPTTDFSLQAISPAIDTGTNLGSPYNLGLSSTSVWPSSVTTLNQNDNGSAWDIGAYVYPNIPSTPTPPTPILSSRSGGHKRDISNLLSLSTSTDTTLLLNQIAALTLQLNSLLTQAHTNTTTSYTPYTFTHNLYYRMVGTDVLHLQQFLNTHGFVLTTTDPGAPGNETTKFGLLTYKALMKFQKSVGLPATGYFGPMTREWVKNSGK